MTSPIACDESFEPSDEIVENLLDADFPASEITVDDDGVVVVGGDAVVTVEASREMAGVDAPHSDGDAFRQYRTYNLVSDQIEAICIDGTDFTGLLGESLDQAIENFNRMDLSFRMVRTTGAAEGCDASIEANLVSGAGGIAGFPALGLPYHEINIGILNVFEDPDVVTHIITHELGHCVGFRHSDYYNRAISCSAGGNEGEAGVGAEYIPGTSPIAWNGGSVMNSCYNDDSNGVWTEGDLAALNELYLKGTEDIVWRHDNGQVHYWAMDQGQRLDGDDIYIPVSSAWTLHGTGDVDGDGTDDVVWQHDNGQVQYWRMDEGQRLSGHNVYNPVSSAWTLRGVGDVDGDGTDDIVWQHDNGQVRYWRMVDGQRASSHDVYIPVSSTWTLRGVGDVSGDGIDDIVWQHDNGQVQYWRMWNGVRLSGHNVHVPQSSSWALRGVGDVSGDGTDDIVWQHDSGQVHYWRMEEGQRLGGHDLHTPVGSDWTFAGVGNID